MRARPRVLKAQSAVLHLMASSEYPRIFTGGGFQCSDLRRDKKIGNGYKPTSRRARCIFGRGPKRSQKSFRRTAFALTRMRLSALNQSHELMRFTSACMAVVTLTSLDRCVSVLFAYHNIVALLEKEVTAVAKRLSHRPHRARPTFRLCCTVVGRRTDVLVGDELRF
jgi:hypothetical protein